MKRSSITLLFASIALLAGSTARAEAFIDLFGGYSNFSNSDSSVDISPVFVPGTFPQNVADLNRIVRTIGQRTTFDNTYTYGGRVGYWFGGWFGLAIDASHFKTEVDSNGFTQNADLDVTPITALVLFRIPLLRDDDFPFGRVHPYAGAGPSIFLTEFDGIADLSVLPLNGNPPTGVVGPLRSTNVNPGLGTIAGIDLGILPFLSVFAEYRFTLANPDFKDNVGGVTTTFQVPLRTNHFVGGLSFRF